MSAAEQTQRSRRLPSPCVREGPFIDAIRATFCRRCVVLRTPGTHIHAHAPPKDRRASAAQHAPWHRGRASSTGA